MHTHILFEHPLNEKMRTWLRIEFLTEQLNANLPIRDHASALHFFRNVGDLLDVFERGDIRTELLKELERADPIHLKSLLHPARVLLSRRLRFGAKITPLRNTLLPGKVQ